MSAGVHFGGKPTNQFEIVGSLGGGRYMIAFSDGRRKRIAPEICMFRIVATGETIPYKPDAVTHPETDPEQARARVRPGQRYTYEIKPGKLTEFDALEATGFYRDPDQAEIIDNRRTPG